MLADDHPLVLDGLRAVLARGRDLAVPARCAGGLAALRAVRRHRPGILVLGVKMPRLDGWAVLRELGSRGLRTRVILLAAGLRAAQLAEAARPGVRGLLLTDMALATPAQCIRTVSEGGRWPQQRSMAGAVQQWLEQARTGHDPAASPTARGLQGVRCVARGRRNRAIAGELATNEGTVKIHRHNACRKLDVEGRLAPSVCARENALA